MRIATLPCQLQPKSTITVVSPLMGILRVYIWSPQTNLPPGFLWAEFEPEIFAAEEKALKEGRRKLDDQEKLQWEIEYPRKKLKLEQEIEEAQRQARLLQLLSTNTELAAQMLKVGTDQPNLMRPEALEKSVLELSLLQRNLDYIERTNFAAIGFDLETQRTDLIRRELDFERRRAQSRFEMPFGGKLTVTVPLTEGVINYPVKTGEELGVARDLSSVRVRVALENVAWTGLPVDRLQVYVRSGDLSLGAKFSYQKIEHVQNRDEAAYYFEFPKEKAVQAARLIGANVSCEVWIDLPEPARVIPKLAIILHQPDAFQTHNWSTALATVFPGARLVVEGQTDLAITLPKDIRLTSSK
ncbi:MAG TPA: hypothetical protein VGR78_05240 [Verrucomicrobiae bacterium]|nr:hypothetical protein [Verrucomicrobiae bacterium]